MTPARITSATHASTCATCNEKHALNLSDPCMQHRALAAGARVVWQQVPPNGYGLNLNARRTARSVGYAPPDGYGLAKKARPAARPLNSYTPPDGYQIAINRMRTHR